MPPALAIVTPSGQSLAEREARLAEALASIDRGAAIVFLRDKSLEPSALGAHARALLSLCAARDARLMVREDAAPAGAGIHLPDNPTQRERLVQLRDAQPRRLVSASTHSAGDARAAAELADFVYLGPIWPTTGKPRGLGPEALRRARRGWSGRARLVAIGGIETPAQVEMALEAGADMVAGIRSFAAPVLAELAKAATGRTFSPD